MTHPTGEFTRDELLRFAADGGFPVTPGQLHLWRDQGLMPAPRRVRPTGRRGGSESRYPASAGPQLLAVAEAIDEDRSLDAARWRLWWRGFDIPQTYIAAQLLAEVELLRGRRDGFRSDRNPDDDEAADLRAAEFKKQTRARTNNRGISRLRKRAGRPGFTTLMTLLMQALAGEYVDHEPEDLKRAATQIGLAPDDQRTFLGGLSALMGPVLREWDSDETMSPEELARDRDELRDILDMFAWLRASPEMVSAIIKQPLPPAVGDLALGFSEEEPGPHDFVVYMALRRNPAAFAPKLGDPEFMKSLKEVFEFLKSLKASNDAKVQST
jgi:hypothetical protein